MKTRALAKIILASIMVISLASGCKDGGPSARIFVKNGDTKRLRVAVLPFDNVSRDQDAGRVITNTIITYLLSTGNFDVVEPGVVYSTMGSEGIRLAEGVTQEVCQKLQTKLSADAFIMGMVEEYGEVRIGSDSYPSISFSARLVDAHTADILWAATISKTGADNVKVFDIGRVSSLGKLTKQAVGAMAASLSRSKGYLIAGMRPGGADAHLIKTGDASNGATIITTSAPASTSSTPGASAQSAKYLDEAATYGEKELTALLKDVGAAKLGAVTYKKHYHDTIETKYQIEGSAKFMEVRLADYRKPAVSEKFIQTYNSSGQPTTFESLPAFTGESGFGYYHLDMAVGRFGVFLRGPKDNKADIEALGKGIIALLR